MQMLVDRVAAESRIPAGVKPLESLASAEYVLSSLWAHDRLRDAWAWRALLVGGGCVSRSWSAGLAQRTIQQTELMQT
jgi:hypothetical protein